MSAFTYTVHLGKVKGTVLQIVESGPVKSADGSLGVHGEGPTLREYNIYLEQFLWTSKTL